MGPSGRSWLVVLLVSATLCAHVSAAASNDTTLLAAERTRRKDPLDGLRYYTGGWNISNRHYLASAGFSAAPVFAFAALWFVAVAAAALIACCCSCCCRGGGGSSSYSYSRRVFALSLLLLLVFTAAAVIGCAVLYDGQGKFNGSTTATLDYVVRQADGAAATMRNFTGLLQTAKTVGGGVASLPADVARSIDDVAGRVDAASDELTARTASNSRRIRTALDTIRKVLIGVAAVMLVLVLLGFVFSLTGKKSLVSIVVFLGWIIITATLILSGTFLLLHNVIGDTCVAMDEWVVQPQGQSHTALDDILPCADAAVTAEALRRSKDVNFQLVSKLNELVSNVSNRDVPAQVGPPLYYNQSGPLVPLLCSPYNAADLSDRSCAAGEVTTDNAQQVWQRYVCRATGSSGQEVCSTVGRLTPAMYSQMVTVAGLSDGLRGQSPALADIASCVTVRRAFQTVSQRGCPPLRRDSGRLYQALLAASLAAMLAAAAWVVHSRERRRRRESERFKVSPYRLPIEEKVLLNSPRRPYRRV
ncbi:unnamed protein product [Miscanthus lutarioriparius]|uniref:Uncharacterized protein n=1 Tax=Miscanthus lutarioriparius TaxID=422564 RepID=A0A811S184_9POAL|nr:unnamed protein product [Miscanthus lutarioriparius]